MTSQETSHASAQTAPNAAPFPGWWRHNRWWLAGAVLIAGATLWMSYRDALDAYRSRHPNIPLAANKSDWTHYAGARWRLTGFETLPPGDPRIRGALRKDAMVVLVNYETIPDSGTKVRDLDTCKGALTDADGRRWEPDPGALPRLSGPRVPTTCGSGYDASFKQILAVPGRPFAFRHAYLIPRTVRREGLHARIEFRNSALADGRFLNYEM